jgi:hypothetical protein
MNTDLTSYVKVYKGLISDELCNRSVEHLQGANWQKEEFYEPRAGENIAPSETLYITRDVISDTPRICEAVWKSLEAYIIKDCNFPWYPGWVGFSQPKYNRYYSSNGMQLHCDHIHSLFPGEVKGVPILTILILLNDDFEGGEFVMFNGQEIKFEKGDVMVFPSNFLFPHKVNNITSGTRYSAVCWSW